MSCGAFNGPSCASRSPPPNIDDHSTMELWNGLSVIVLLFTGAA